MQRYVRVIQVCGHQGIIIGHIRDQLSSSERQPGLSSVIVNRNYAFAGITSSLYVCPGGHSLQARHEDGNLLP